MAGLRSHIGVWARAIGGRYRETPILCVAGQDGDRKPQHCPAVGLSDDGIAIGEWPEDPHVEPSWVRRCDARFGEPLRIRTRAQFEQACELCTMSADMETSEYQGAVKFLAWMRETNRTGNFTAAQLSNAYELHCRTLGCEPASEAHMRGHLLKLEGVTKALQEAGNGRKRNRPTIWTIAPLQVAQKKRVERREPMRMAA